jgi:hypothetical protein
MGIEPLLEAFPEQEEHRIFRCSEPQLSFGCENCSAPGVAQIYARLAELSTFR